MIRKQLILTGVVQGVGFRPNVIRIAARHQVTGLCGNDDNSVFIEAQGEPAVVAAFLDAVRTDLPPLATIIAWRESDLVPIAETGFRIVGSRRAAGAITLIPADAATCPDCAADMADPANRRYRYPFTTCTNCGPRLSIIRDVPYDRPLTTMAEFPMCEACRAEYEDPADRRYHAQPISCFDCGPTLWLEASPDHPVTGSDTWPTAGDPDRRGACAATIETAKALLADGRILAVKGIGGFTLMCDARNETAVATLRSRKRRPGKPFAVMAGSLAAAGRIAELGAEHRRDLTSREAPIVLAPMARAYDLAQSVAPGLDDVGVMLPYAPLHRRLLSEGDIMVATSANSSSKPLTYRNPDARTDLAHIVDAFLMHDRGIHIPVEDSVVQTAPEATRPIRRSRGYAPLPVFLDTPDRCVLAVGAELKNTFALTRDGMAFVSAHIGDMGTLETQRAFEKSVAQMVTAHRRTPSLVVTDKHPGYATRAWGHRYAGQLGIPVLEIQHHHAHALALLAENRLATPPATYIVLDGTGYGDDATIWGGEILRLHPDPLVYDRVWHLPAFWLPGGDSAVRHPWKAAAGLAWEHGLDLAALPAYHGWAENGVPGADPATGIDEWALVRSQLERQAGVVRTTSTGRVFDAVASMLGLRHTVTYEAQAAMELESLARRCRHRHDPAGADLPALLATIADGAAGGQPVECLARLFHLTLARLVTEALCFTQDNPGVVGLTGGVFANRLLTADLVADLESNGFEVVQHRIVPANDGGLALGQALAGVLRAERT